MSAALVDQLQLCQSSPRNDETIAKRPLNAVGAKHLNSLDGWSGTVYPLEILWKPNTLMVR